MTWKSSISKLWQTLGSFYQKFVSGDDRYVWESYWHGLMSSVANVWATAHQRDLDKNLFDASGLMRHTAIPIKLFPVEEELGSTVTYGDINGSSLRVHAQAGVLENLPDQGQISWDGNVVPYSGKNVYGPRSAILKVEGSIPGDSPKIDEPLGGTEVPGLVLARTHVIGEDILYLASTSGMDASGIIYVDGEELRYHGLSETSVVLETPLTRNHGLDVKVRAYAISWKPTSGWSGTTGGGSVVLSGNSEVTSPATIASNSDFSISVFVKTSNMQTLDRAGIGVSGIGSSSKLYLTKDIAGNLYVGSTQLSQLQKIELIISRSGNTIIFEYGDGHDVFHVSDDTMDGGVKSVHLLTEGIGSAEFFQIERRAGDTDAGPRVWESLKINEPYPFRYAMDLRVSDTTSGISMSPEPISVGATVESVDGKFVSIQEKNIRIKHGLAAGTEFILVEQGLIEMSSGTHGISGGDEITLKNLDLDDEDDFVAPGDGTISFRRHPRQDTVWPVSSVGVDETMISNTYGRMIGVVSDTTTKGYVARVRGLWSVLMMGPSVRNIKAGTALSLGIPVSMSDGYVEKIDTHRNILGRITWQRMTIAGKEYELPVGMDWNLSVGDQVKKFQPLSDGVKIDEAVGTGLGRFNTFTVTLAANAVTSAKSITDVKFFLDKIKFSHTRYEMDVIDAGSEYLADDCADNISATIIPALYEDMTFDEGEVPSTREGGWALGEGYRLGQGLLLGRLGDWYAKTIGMYQASGPYDDGITNENNFELSGEGGYSFLVRTGGSGEGLAGSIFECATGGFTDDDVGRTLSITPNDIVYTISGLISATKVTLEGPGFIGSSGPWEIRETGFTVDDIGKTISVMSGSDIGNYRVHEVSSRTSVVIEGGPFSAQEANLLWEIRDYVKFEDITLDEYEAYKTPLPGNALPSEELETVQTIIFSVEA